MRFIRDTKGVELVILDPVYPIGDDDLVAMIEEAILKEEAKVGVTGGKIKLAVIDAISSMPGVRVPFERIIKLLREHQILSLIDGAHAIGKQCCLRCISAKLMMLTTFTSFLSQFFCFHIGQIPLNLRETDPDFFLSNCHKWLYTVRGSSILYVPKRNQRYIHPAITSEHYKDHSDLNDDTETFRQEFSWQGTQDFSSFLTTFAGGLIRISLLSFTS